MIDWSALLASEKVIGALVGALFGSIVTLMITWSQRRQARLVAKMQVATRLRHWGSNLHDLLCDAANFETSDGHAGRYHFELPKMLLEAELGQVAAMEPKLAERVFELIHRKDEMNAKIRATLEFLDPDDASSEFCDSGAKLYLEAARIYEEVAASLSWSTKAFPSAAVETMRRELKKRSREGASF